MKYLSPFDAAEKWGLSPRRAGILRSENGIPDAIYEPYHFPAASVVPHSSFSFPIDCCRTLRTSLTAFAATSKSLSLSCHFSQVRLPSPKRTNAVAPKVQIVVTSSISAPSLYSKFNQILVFQISVIGNVVFNLATASSGSPPYRSAGVPANLIKQRCPSF